MTKISVNPAIAALLKRYGYGPRELELKGIFHESAAYNLLQNLRGKLRSRQRRKPPPGLMQDTSPFLVN